MIRAFSEMYRKHSTDFRSAVSEADYRRRMELSYRIRPELFDRLFGDWSALDKFQRTRGFCASWRRPYPSCGNGVTDPS